MVPLYQRAIELVPEDSGIKENEKILVPSLKLLSYLRKGLWRGEIEVCHFQSFLVILYWREIGIVIVY